MPERRLKIDELIRREFWTCSQAARVLGRNADWWKARFDEGAVEGYTGGGKGGMARHIKAESARALLHNYCTARRSQFTKSKAVVDAEYLRGLREFGAFDAA